MSDDINNKIIRMNSRHASRPPQLGGGKAATIPARRELSEAERHAVIRNALIAALLDMSDGAATFSVEHLQQYWNSNIVIKGGTDEATGNPQYTITLEKAE